jgi:undecaprenyl-diphosphatase
MFENLELIDRQLFLMINKCHAPILDNVMFYISKVWVFFPLFFMWLYLVFKKIGTKKIAILIGFLVLLVSLTDQTSNQIKHAVKRYRPTHNLEIQNQIHTVNDYKGGKYGFFSGHATNTFGIAMLLFLLFNKKSKVFRFSFFLWAALISYSRIYLGVHYPSDIFIGAIVGLFWGFMIYQFIQYTFKKQFNEIISI